MPPLYTAQSEGFLRSNPWFFEQTSDFSRSVKLIKHSFSNIKTLFTPHRGENPCVSSDASLIHLLCVQDIPSIGYSLCKLAVVFEESAFAAEHFNPEQP